MASLPTLRRGRPTAQTPAARALILDALVRILDAAPLARPTLRAVARSAGVTPALLHYHFDDLAGLMRCLHEERAMPLIHPALQELLAGQSRAGPALTRFIQQWTGLTLRHPWLAACLLQIPVESSPTAAGLCSIVQTAVSAAQWQGAVRRDLPDHYIALLLLSLGVMPHLALTALGHGVDPQKRADPQGAATLTLQHLAVLQSGAAGAQSPRQDSAS